MLGIITLRVCLKHKRSSLTKTPWNHFNTTLQSVVCIVFFSSTLAANSLRSPLVHPPSHGCRSTHNSPIHTATGSRLTQNFSVSVPTLIYTGTRLLRLKSWGEAGHRQSGRKVQAGRQCRQVPHIFSPSFSHWESFCCYWRSPVVFSWWNWGKKNFLKNWKSTCLESLFHIAILFFFLTLQTYINQILISDTMQLVFHGKGRWNIAFWLIEFQIAFKRNPNNKNIWGLKVLWAECVILWKRLCWKTGKTVFT